MPKPHRGRFRWRTRLRRHLPWRLLELGVARKGATDCGAHEWYIADNTVDQCYHCVPGRLPKQQIQKPVRESRSRQP